MMRKYYAYEDDLNMLPPNPLEPTMFTVYLAAEVDAALAEAQAQWTKTNAQYESAAKAVTRLTGALAERDARIDELTKESERLRTNCTESATRQYADKLSMDRDMLEADNHEKDTRIAELDKLTSMQSGSFIMLHGVIAERDAELERVKSAMASEYEMDMNEQLRKVWERDATIANREKECDVLMRQRDLARAQLESQSITYQDNLTEIQLLKADLVRLREALKRLGFGAQITGGTAGRDDSLCEAIAHAELALAPKEAE